MSPKYEPSSEPLHISAVVLTLHHQVVELLSTSGADVEAGDRAGDGPLALAAAHGKSAAIEVRACGLQICQDNST